MLGLRKLQFLEKPRPKKIFGYFLLKFRFFGIIVFKKMHLTQKLRKIAKIEILQVENLSCKSREYACFCFILGSENFFKVFII